MRLFVDGSEVFSVVLSVHGRQTTEQRRREVSEQSPVFVRAETQAVAWARALFEPTQRLFPAVVPVHYTLA